MEDTQTWLFVIEVGTSQLRNNVSLLHHSSETNGDILFDATCIKIHADYAIDAITEPLNSAKPYIPVEVLFFAIISLQAFGKGG